MNGLRMTMKHQYIYYKGLLNIKTEADFLNLAIWPITRELKALNLCLPLHILAT